MKVPTLRTFNRPLFFSNDYIEEADRIAEQIRPRRLLRKMVANPDYERFQAINRRAAGGDVRFSFVFPEEEDKIVLTIADRKNPTIGEAVNAFLNIFRKQEDKVDFPTMTHKEMKEFMKNLFKIRNAKEYPVRTIVIDPDKPYADKVARAVREFANERLFGKK